MGGWAFSTVLNPAPKGLAVIGAFILLASPSSSTAPAFSGKGRNQVRTRKGDQGRLTGLLQTPAIPIGTHGLARVSWAAQEDYMKAD